MIGRFEVHKRLGEGFQGKVYLGWDPELRRQVALKVITFADGEVLQSRDVVEEARIAASISHPNVIPIYEVGIYYEKPLLVFEYVDGLTLAEFIRKNGALDLNDALSVMVRIASGLACAHEQNIVHLDISPNNIMLDKEGRPRIMDFGLARVTETFERNQRNKRVFGTPRYISPEHLLRGDLNTTTDIFSLGLLFFELLTGMPAFDQKELEDVFRAVETVDIDWGKLQYQGFNPAIIAVLRDMLQINPHWRYQNANELIPALDNVITMQRQEEQGSLALDFLLRRLERRPEFPACSHSIGEINRLTEEGSNTDFNKLGAVIARDYSLTNRVLKIANSVIFDRSNEGVKTISLAISRLGLKLVRMICNGLLLFKQVDNMDSELKDIVVSSFVAGIIARHIMTAINRRLAEEAFICGLFHHLGTHLLVFYLPDEYEDICRLIAAGKDRQEAERTVLSTTSAALGAAVADKWNFPDIIRKSMTQLPPGTLCASSSDEDILCHVANFSNELCELFVIGPDNPDLIRLTDDFLLRHHVIYKADHQRLASLAGATADKFSKMAPDLGINFSESSFCQCMENFIRNLDELLQSTPQDDFPSALSVAGS